MSEYSDDEISREIIDMAAAAERLEARKRPNGKWRVQIPSRSLLLPISSLALTRDLIA
jgi:hypothetical protein